MPEGPHYTFRLLPEPLAICRLEPDAPFPAWCEGAGFRTVTRTSTELSVVCAERLVPPGIRSVGGRRALGIEGVVDFSTVGVLAGLLGPAADEGLSVFVISTFDTDYVLVEERNLAALIAVWRRLGHEVAT